MISPEISIETDIKEAAFGGLKVLKFRYLSRSNALTVPSNEQDINMFPFGWNLSEVIYALWSSNEAKLTPL